MKLRFRPDGASVALACITAMLFAGCDKPREVAGASPPATSVGMELDDTVITTRVKSALLADAEVKSFDFKVETRKGEVQLSGFVDSQIQLDRALTLARAVEGVKSIDSKVTMKGATPTLGNQVDDGVMTTKIKSALLADSSIKSFDIAVVTRKGQVQLSGFVDNQGQIDRALEVARGIEGVGVVGNELSIKK